MFVHGVVGFGSRLNASAAATGLILESGGVGLQSFGDQFENFAPDTFIVHNKQYLVDLMPAQSAGIYPNSQWAGDHIY